MGAITLVSPRTDADAAFGRKLWQWLKPRKPEAEYDLTTRRVTVRFAFNTPADLALGLDSLTAWNVEQNRHEKWPFIYDAGVHYEREILCTHNGVTQICEEWYTTRELLKRKAGDCEDLACTTAAQRILQGEHARAFARRSSCGWHIQVRRADGTVEDPSAKLGMLG
jgi:hypothetical protein